LLIATGEHVSTSHAPTLPGQTAAACDEEIPLYAL
jgi:hypothetical protein